jgi:hypothetical protein
MIIQQCNGLGEQLTIMMAVSLGKIGKKKDVGEEGWTQMSRRNVVSKNS